jgi:hypothetical protein
MEACYFDRSLWSRLTSSRLTNDSTLAAPKADRQRLDDLGQVVLGLDRFDILHGLIVKRAF